MKKILLYILLSTFSELAFGQIDSVYKDGHIIAADKKLNVVTKAEGDSAYMRNEYGKAIQIYETLLKRGEAAEIYYNLGNSYYKSEEIARAILNYERALLLQPGSADIQANLEIARAKTIDKVELVPEIFFVTWTKALINSMSMDAWAILGIVSFVLFVTALVLFIFSKQIVWKKIGFISGVVCLIIVISSNLFAWQLKKRLVNRTDAIIITPSVTVRSTPSENGTSLFILHEGRKVNIKDNSMKGWKEIRLEDGKVGWVSSTAVEEI